MPRVRGSGVRYGGPFTTLAWYQPIYGSVVLVLGTLIDSGVGASFCEGGSGGGNSSAGGPLANK